MCQHWSDRSSAAAEDFGADFVVGGAELLGKLRNNDDNDAQYMWTMLAASAVAKSAHQVRRPPISVLWGRLLSRLFRSELINIGETTD